MRIVCLASEIRMNASKIILPQKTQTFILWKFFLHSFVALMCEYGTSCKNFIFIYLLHKSCGIHWRSLDYFYMAIISGRTIIPQVVKTLRTLESPTLPQETGRFIEITTQPSFIAVPHPSTILRGRCLTSWQKFEDDIHCPRATQNKITRQVGINWEYGLNSKH